MKKTGIIVLLLIIYSFFLNAEAQPKTSPVDLFYPYQDAANSRWFYFSSACRPFGLVNLNPDTELEGAWGSGYRYDTYEIKGFSHVHAWQLSALSVMPVNGKAQEVKNDFYLSGCICIMKKLFRVGSWCWKWDRFQNEIKVVFDGSCEFKFTIEYTEIYDKVISICFFNLPKGVYAGSIVNIEF